MPNPAVNIGLFGGTKAIVATDVTAQTIIPLQIQSANNSAVSFKVNKLQNFDEYAVSLFDNVTNTTRALTADATFTLPSDATNSRYSLIVTPLGVTGTKANLATTLRAYPNPANGSFTLAGLTKTTQVSIFTTAGKEF
jgi:hypothetical protein